jgi:spermidine synthase
MSTEAWADRGTVLRRVRLRDSDRQARVVADGFSQTGYTLEIDGIEQSHVDLADPTVIRHEYLARIVALIEASVGDAAAEEASARPLSVLHLGAGALTLARYLQVRHPGTEQVTVDVERELMSFVVGALPLPSGTRLTPVVADARAFLESAAAATAAGRADGAGPIEGTTGRDDDAGWRADGAAGPFDVVVLDVFSGEETPSHLTGSAVYAACLDVLTPGGVLAVNVGDDAGLRFFATQAAALEKASADAGLSGPWTLAAASTVDRLEEGNLVLAAGGGLGMDGPQELREHLQAAGPHPAAVLDPYETARLVERITRPVGATPGRW